MRPRREQQTELRRPAREEQGLPTQPLPNCLNRTGPLTTPRGRLRARVYKRRRPLSRHRRRGEENTGCAEKGKYSAGEAAVRRFCLHARGQGKLVLHIACFAWPRLRPCHALLRDGCGNQRSTCTQRRLRGLPRHAAGMTAKPDLFQLSPLVS